MQDLVGTGFVPAQSQEMVWKRGAPVTAPRRFAVTINLNDDYEGGELSFPEYGPRTFNPPIGCAVAFSCSLIHAVSTLTRGRRAFLPFLYDEAAAKIREQNSRYLAQGV